MTALYGIWRTLDLAPTGDTSAIRKAYARALKAFDMDDEPARYIALREARDMAIAQAPYFDAEDALETDDQDEETLADTAPSSDQPEPVWDERWTAEGPDDDSYDEFADIDWHPEPPHAAPIDTTPDRDDSTRQHIAAMQDHYDAVHTMLFPGDERAGQSLDRIAASVLVERVDALLADPRMEEIGFHAEAETWFAHIIAASPVRSDPILTQVIGHFNWLASRGRIDQSAAVTTVVERYDALVFVTELQDPKHRLHAAWRELRKPAQERSRKTFGVRGSKVRELLSKIRLNHPTLEPQLDWYRVSIWERPSGFLTKVRNWSIVVVSIFLLYGVILSATHETPRQTMVPIPMAESYVSADATLDPLLALFGGSALNMAKIRTANPKLHNQLETNWTIARENGIKPAQFQDNMRALLVDRYIAGIARAPHALLVDLARLRLDKATELRTKSWVACTDFLKRGVEPPTWQAPDMTARREALMTRVLLETNGDPGDKPAGTTFRVSGEVVDAATKRAGIPRADFTKAMVNKGSAENQCKATIALGETALALPPAQADTILRNL